MNTFIQQQLSKVKNVKMPQFDSMTNCMIIHKAGNQIINEPSSNELHIARQYIIKLASYIINPPDGFNLHENWNKGIKPTFDIMSCLVLQQAGKMIKIRGIQYDINTSSTLDKKWEGWVPQKSITIIKEI